jgi:sodium-coupled neutral amino acid transporter 11
VSTRPVLHSGACSFGNSDLFHSLLEYELDSDEVDDTELPRDMVPQTSSRTRSDQSMPLLVGLFESSAARRSLEVSGAHEMVGEGGYDMEELAAKRTAGGGMVDSIANMANSILGAGTLSLTRCRLQRLNYTLW